MKRSDWTIGYPDLGPKLHQLLAHSMNWRLISSGIKEKMQLNGSQPNPATAMPAPDSLKRDPKHTAGC